MELGSQTDGVERLGSRRERKRRQRQGWYRPHRAHATRREPPAGSSDAQARHADPAPDGPGSAGTGAVPSSGPAERSAVTSSEQAIPASDRRVLHELVDGLSSSDAVAAHRFLSYLQVTPDPSGQPRYYGDPGQSVDVDAPYWDPVVILIGPCDGMGAIDDLIDAIDRAPFLSVSFRLFRDGIYRVDGRTTDRVRLGEWLAARKRVRSVVDDKAALHVRPLPLVP